MAVLGDIPKAQKNTFLEKCIDKVWENSYVSASELSDCLVGCIPKLSAVQLYALVLKDIKKVCISKDCSNVDPDLLEILNKNTGKIKEGLKSKFLSEKETLLDFDWKANIVLESSKISNLNNTLVMLSFYVKDKPTVMVECNEEELEMMIQELENAKSAALSVTS